MGPCCSVTLAAAAFMFKGPPMRRIFAKFSGFQARPRREQLSPAKATVDLDLDKKTQMLTYKLTYSASSITSRRRIFISASAMWAAASSRSCV